MESQRRAACRIFGRVFKFHGNLLHSIPAPLPSRPPNDLSFAVMLVRAVQSALEVPVEGQRHCAFTAVAGFESPVPEPVSPFTVGYPVSLM